MLGQEAHRQQSHLLHRLQRAGVEGALALQDQLFVQVDLHRADIAARATGGAGKRHAAVLPDVAAGAQRGADRPRNDVAVAVAGGAAVYRAGVHAGAAADAAQALREVVAAEDVAAAVIDDDDVHLPARPRLLEVRRVSRNRRADGGACQQAGEHTQVRLLGDDFFQPHAGDMDGWQRGAEVGIAFVGAHHHATGFGDGEVDAGQAGTGGEEMFAQVGACGVGQVGRVVVAGLGAEFFVEQLGDLFLLQVNCRHHDVARRLVAQLHDALAEVGIDYLDAVLFQIRVQPAFLGQHRL